MKGNQSYLKKLSINLLAVILATLCSACSFTQVVPLQLGRISQSDTFVQKFSFLDKLSADSGTSSPYSEQRLYAGTQKMDQIFTLMLGDKNWQNIKDLYGLGNLRQELLAKKIYIKGFTNIIIYPDPFDANLFSIDGSGRYFMIREKNDAILLTGDYSFYNQQHAISDLKKGYIVLDAKLYLIKIPGLVTYYHEAPIKYKIFIDISLADKQVYSVDYNKKHLAYLVEEDEELETTAPFASISFSPPSRPVKLWDMRGIEFMRRDYEKMLHPAQP